MLKTDELVSLMRDRRSIRKFSNEPVSTEALSQIITTAYFAPTAANAQGFLIIVVDDPEVREKIQEVCEQGDKAWVFNRPKVVQDSIMNSPGFSFKKSFLTEAPVLLIVATNPKDPSIPYPIESCWVAITYMLLTIESLELGTVTYTPGICLTDMRVELNKLLDLPEEQHIQVILPLGHYIEKPQRKKAIFEQKVYLNRYNVLYQPH